MPVLMIIGATLFFTGGGLFLILLFINGGVQRSRQFAVLGQLTSGEFGKGKQMLSILSMCLLALGTVSLLGGVVVMDAQRAERCRRHCEVAGFAQGTIGPSLDRTAANRFVACTCTSANREPLELRADALSD